MAMSQQVFGNSNSLPISLVMSLSQTLKGLHWDRVPNDNDDEVAARGILYLLIFQQLGQLVRWSWGYHVLLAPKDKYTESIDDATSRIEHGQAHYTDNPEQTDPDELLIRTRSSDEHDRCSTTSRGRGSGEFPSGEETPVTSRTYSYTKLSSLHGGQEETGDVDQPPSMISRPHRGPLLTRQNSQGQGLPEVEIPVREEEEEDHSESITVRQSPHFAHRATRCFRRLVDATFSRLPTGMQKALSTSYSWTRSFLHGLWAFMNPPLWAMLVSIIVASVPSLHNLFFSDGTFVRNSVTRAIDQNGQVAVPLILVVLGANLARNTLPEEAVQDLEHPKEERKLIVASLVARMLLPTLVMAPLLAFVAKYVPVSILDDPIFIIVCFLLTGAPSALQLAQICQINNVYVGAMSKLLFQSYVIW